MYAHYLRDERVPWRLMAYRGSVSVLVRSAARHRERIEILQPTWNTEVFESSRCGPTWMCVAPFGPLVAGLYFFIFLLPLFSFKRPRQAADCVRIK
jgi:hypothetical protein